MNIESVRALKSEVIESIVEPATREAGGGRRLGLSARSMERARTLGPDIALGVGKHGDQDYRLVVRIQRRLFELEEDIREKIERRARGEVDIRYVGEIKKAQVPWHQTRRRPLLCGLSVAHFDVTAGTLGCFALESKTQKHVILSNNHVLANEDRAKPGDAVLQPGRYDRGRRSRDTVGALLKSVPLKTGSPNLVDAAIASLNRRIKCDPTTLTGLGTLAGLKSDQVQPGDKVAKVGRTTGMTRGIVTAIELDGVVVTYDRGNLTFDSQIEIEGAGGRGFSSGGDSGSLIVDDHDDRHYGCALLFAGSDQGGSNGMGLTYANDLKSVLNALAIQLVVNEHA